MKQALAAGLAVAAIVLSFPGLVSAASPVHGITVEPAIQQFTLAPGQDSLDFTTTVINNTAATVVVTLAAQDFTTIDRNGSAVLSTGTNGRSPHGLANALQIGIPQVVLAPGTSRIIPVTVVHASGLATGGHYAALTYSLAAAPASGGNSISVHQVVSSLIFLTTAGAGTQSLHLSTPLLGKFVGRLPTSVNLVLADTGNTQTVPRGVVQLYGPHSRLLAQGVINPGSSLILPGSQRLFTTGLTAQGRAPIWPGTYRLHVAYRHDGQDSFTEYDERFTYLGQPLILLGLLVLAVVACIAVIRIIRWRLRRRVSNR